MKTGIKFKPCNVGTAEAHNRRDKAYCEAVARKYGHTYFWDEYRHLNESWRNPEYTMSLPDLLEDMKVIVKEKTKRSMQCKPVKYKDRKTGKERERSGCSAIREGCPPIKPDTRIEDFDHFRQWLEGYGLKVISIDLHHDEGHPDPETDDLLPNHHAHIIVDWLDHKTGKTVKIDNEVCKQMQTVLAESLGMERGTPKEDTGIEGLSAIEYKEKMAVAHLRQLNEQCAEKERRNEQLDTEAIDRSKEIAELDQKREAKKKAIDEENGSAVKEGLANLFGKGKYARLEKENKVLAAENEEMKKEVTRMEHEVAKIPIVAEREARKIVEAKEAEHKRRLTVKEGEIDKLSSQLDNLRQEYKRLETSSNDRIKFLERQRDEFSRRIQEMMKMISDSLKKAVETMVAFSKARLQDFIEHHVRIIVGFVRQYSDRRQAADLIKIFSRPFLSDVEHNRACSQLDKMTDNFASYEQRYLDLSTPSRGMRR